MITSPDYHKEVASARPLPNEFLAYDDFEIRRRKWADDRIRSHIACDHNLNAETRSSSLKVLEALSDDLGREIQQEYRRNARLRGEADHAYDELSARIEAVKSQLSVLEFVESTSPRTMMISRGNRLVGHCPYHVEKSPSFVIFPDGHAWCFGCQRGGDLFDVIGLVEGLDRFYDQLRHAEHFLGIVPENRSFPSNSYRELVGKEQSQPNVFHPIRVANGRVVR